MTEKRKRPKPNRTGVLTSFTLPRELVEEIDREAQRLGGCKGSRSVVAVKLFRQALAMSQAVAE